MSKPDSTQPPNDIQTSHDVCTLTCTAVADLAGARVWRSADLMRIERAALEHGLPLMERAGRAAAQLILRLYPAIHCAAIVAGSGNNGGDAWVCARYLRQCGVHIRILAASEARTDAARQARHLYEVCQANHPTQADAEDDDLSDGSQAGIGDGTPPNAPSACAEDSTPPNASRACAEDGTPPNAPSACAEDNTPSNASRACAEDGTPPNAPSACAEDGIPPNASRTSSVDGTPPNAPSARAGAQHQSGQGRGQGVDNLLSDVDVIVDGLLGTGVSGPPRAEYTQIIDRINASGLPVLSLDLPSGLHPDTGAGYPVRAKHTLSFLALKHALFTAPGSTCAGEVYLCELGLEQMFNGADLGIGQTNDDVGLGIGQTIAGADSRLEQTNDDADLDIGQTNDDAGLGIGQTNDDADLGLEQTITGADLGLGQKITGADLGLGQSFYGAVPHWYELATAVPRLHRRPDSHKGDCGCVWIIGGQGLSEGASMAGAVLLAARAAARGGCGLVRVFSHSDHAGLLATDFRDAIYHDALAGWPAGRDHPGTVGVLGPGLGRSRWSDAVFASAIQLPGPMVIDADGLNILAAQADTQTHASQWIITPHPKEAARLLDVSTEQIQHDRFKAAAALAKRYNCIAVLKGHATIISDGERMALCPYGNPGMSCAGMGDVLSGIIAALLAQGLKPYDACTQGVALHARTADRLATLGKGQSLTASDVAEAIRV